ncbi:YciI family protein [Desulfocurvibacter africanus]|uniref:YCII-related protein n=1 Tax=Desulfocurvibacter africanus subsp. africanus str. Walvis Bay TaxID=690850 RepID=F3YUV8_DESAF|nr:YciI family protein [Desulfocurvibacter africanus]EGJ49135.1 YCII-related protein [Desulfocurvibacter africanus subsp. africanus str. Walvis Bay]
MFIVSVTYTADLSQIDAHLPAHIEFLKKHFDAGNFLLSGRKQPRTGGIIIAAMHNEQELWSILRQDPFHLRGVAEYALTRFLPTMSREDVAFLREV